MTDWLTTIGLAAGSFGLLAIVAQITDRIWPGSEVGIVGCMAMLAFWAFLCIRLALLV